MTTSRREFLRAAAALSAAGLLGPRGRALAQSRGFTEYRQHDAMALADLVRRGEASPEELLDLAIQRTEAINPTINAVTQKHPDSLSL